MLLRPWSRQERSMTEVQRKSDLYRRDCKNQIIMKNSDRKRSVSEGKRLCLLFWDIVLLKKAPLARSVIICLTVSLRGLRQYGQALPGTQRPPLFCGLQQHQALMEWCRFLFLHVLKTRSVMSVQYRSEGLAPFAGPGKTYQVWISPDLRCSALWSACEY